MPAFVVFDTNVVISAQITKNPNSPTVRIFRAILDGTITPVFHPDIIAEYRAVLNRPKFMLQSDTIDAVLSAITQFGIEAPITPSGLDFPDENDRIFYEVTLSKSEDDAHLVTGNKRHFPNNYLVVTPAELVELLGL